jgi:hypothetical protein
MHGLDKQAVWTLAQFDWGLRRFFIDALLFWGNIRSAYRELRTKTYEELITSFDARRINTEAMQKRGTHYPLKHIKDEDRYLISEMACKAYAASSSSEPTLVEQLLVEAFRASRKSQTTIGKLVNGGASLATCDAQTQLLLDVGAEELFDTVVKNERDIRSAVGSVRRRFEEVRPNALWNTNLYLSLVNELDVYVATSMRKRGDFLSLAATCRQIFERNDLKKLNVRYFDPTLSAAECHEDKGLIECLMVKCCKVTLYFAGEGDSFGKDAEIAMCMSLGKPVVILCPDTDRGKQREKIFREIHPLSRLIEFQTGLANGAIVTRSPEVATLLLERLLDNRMEFDLVQNGDGYFRLRERLTGSVVRLQTNHRLLRETFWNCTRSPPPATPTWPPA